jgi:hypothetical protein
MSAMMMAILVGGPADGLVIALAEVKDLVMPELRVRAGQDVAQAGYRDSGHVVDGAHVFVVSPDWTPPPIDWISAHINWRNVFYAAMHHGGDPKHSPLVAAFHTAWRTHFPKRLPSDRINYVTGSRIEFAGCGGHAEVWPCSDAKAMARTLGGTETCERAVFW